MTKDKTHLKERKSVFRSISFWSYWGIVLLSIYISWQISTSLSVANYIPKENASNILNALLDAEIALVGFWAIILVYIFNTLRGAKERVSRNKHELEVKRDAQELKLGPESREQLQPLWEKYKSRIDELDKEFRQLVTQTFITTLNAVVIVLMLFWGIFQTISSIGFITDRGLYYWNLFYCLFPVFMTFMLIFNLIIFSQPKRETDILKQELRKEWKKAKAQRQRER